MIFGKPRLATIALNMRPKRGPYGGGNQWLKQVSTFLERSGYRVVHELGPRVDCVLGTHAGLTGALAFSYSAVIEARRREPGLVCIQRINDNDLRKGTTQMDALLAEANAAADHTVFVSSWLRDYHAARWFAGTKPHSVILNGADPAIFHPVGAARWREGVPLRLVTHHWSDNMSKGFDVYAEIDRLIAEGTLRDVELWIVGRRPGAISWRSARLFPPCSGHALAAILRQAHVCVTASRYEPGAMHPVEALQCGLPLLYHPESGGTVELGRDFGVEIAGNLPSAISEMKLRYEALRHRALAEAPAGDLMCVRYRSLIQSLLAAKR